MNRTDFAMTIDRDAVSAAAALGPGQNRAQFEPAKRLIAGSTVSQPGVARSRA